MSLINFSIVIPVHNKETYIHKTINSVLSQTFTNFELILVNDGSSDNSGLICDEYALKDPRVKVKHQINGGVSSARNTGVKEAIYDHIAFIDADDYWNVNFLKEMTNLINVFPDNKIYSAKFATIKNNNILEDEIFFPNNEKYLEFDLIEKCFNKARFPMHTSSVVIKKKVFEKVNGFDERIHVFEDYDLFLRISLLSKVGYLNLGPYSFYNLDVPAESKNRGRLPLLSKNWISFMDKFDNESVVNGKFKFLLDRMKLNQMVTYRRSRNYNDEVRQVLATVDKSNYGWKYRIIFSLPVFLGDRLLKLYSFFIRLRIKITR
jgi:glycosyltransferase involved in cell wall biosynthesis